jgi:tetratricopeptide (TPR) repeat protein
MTKSRQAPRDDRRTIAHLSRHGKPVGEVRLACLAFATPDRFSSCMRFTSFLFTFLLLPTVATADVLDDPSIGGGDRYNNCLLLTRREPQRALDAALDWEKTGNHSAMHCTAVALVALRRYPEAAGRLDKLARITPGAADSATLYDQAGNAWLLAHRADDARLSFSAAIALVPNDPDLLADRARAYALSTNWQSADADLTAALSKNPNRADLLVLRASARHAQGRKADARADIDQALRVQPDSAEALEERGEMKSEAGDNAGAKADWQAVVAKSPRSAAAVDAKQHLDALNPPPVPSTPAPQPPPTH